MIKQLIILFSFLCMISNASAEQFLLYHANKGVLWMHNGKKEAARRGIFIHEKESIVLTVKGDVMLIQDNGISVLLDEPGTYSFQKIKNLFQSAKSKNISARFFSYVFEKFLSGSEDEKQKVTAVVYRGKRAMLSPADSGFIFTNTVKLSWKPEQVNLPYKIRIQINGHVFDTIIRKQNFLTIPSWLLEKNADAVCIRWTCFPYDLKKTVPPPFVLVRPASGDAVVIQQQLKQLRTAYATKKDLLKVMEKDLLERWMELYQFQ